MTVPRIVTLVILAAWSSPASLAEAVPQSRSTPVLAFPPPLSAKDRDWMLRVMDVSDEQRAVIDAMFDEHVRSEAALRSERIPPLNERARLYLADNKNADEWEVIMAQRSAIVDALRNQDLLLFGRIRTVLAASQYAGCDRAEWRRERTIAVDIRSLRPGVNIDLTALVDDLVAQQVIAIDNEDMFHEECVLYEREVTPLMRLRVAAQINVRAEDPRLFEQLRSLPPDSAEFKRAQRRQDANYRDIYRLDRRVHDINAAYVERIGATVDAAGALALRSLFRVQAYPNIYPSPFDCERLLSSVIQKLESDDRREKFIELLREWRETEEQLSARMVHEHMAWMEALMRNRATQQPAYDLYETQLSRLQAERKEASRRVIERLRGESVDGLGQDVSQAITELANAIEQHRSRRNGVVFFP